MQHFNGITYVLSPAFSNTSSSNRLDLLTTRSICSQTSADCHRKDRTALKNTNMEQMVIEL